MANYVLVHGAWGCGAMYGEVPARLRAEGHNVLVAQLTGLGTRQDELHPGITLSDHVRDVLIQVEASGFERFILAGHSYGGMVITGVAARLGARIDSICYIDAFLPEDGQSLWDITGEFEHNWYVDTQKHKPGYVDLIGAPDLLETSIQRDFAKAGVIVGMIANYKPFVDRCDRRFWTRLQGIPRAKENCWNIFCQ